VNYREFLGSCLFINFLVDFPIRRLIDRDLIVGNFFLRHYIPRFSSSSKYYKNVEQCGELHLDGDAGFGVGYGFAGETGWGEEGGLGEGE
jgi:hypothetical protein